MYTTNEQKYGVPDIPDAPLDDDDDDDPLANIVGALTRQPTKMMNRAAMEAEAAGEEVPVSMMTADDIIHGANVDPDAPAAVRQVQEQWNVELTEHAKAAEQELQNLRLRHMQDLEEAKNAGVSDDVLKKLQKDHEDELLMLKEQNQTLRHEIIRQAQRAEAAALLTSAHDMQSKDGIPHTQKEDDRLNDLFDHLKETCDSKDEVLVRLFDLVCLRESELKDLEENMIPMAMAMAPQMSGGGDNAAEVEKLKAEIKRKDQHIEALKGLVNVQSTAPQGTRAVAGAAPMTRTAVPVTRAAPTRSVGGVSGGYMAARGTR